MPTRYGWNGKVYYMGKDGQWHEIGKIEDFDITMEVELMNDVEIINKLKNYETHWYIAVPFTKKRLIFTGLKYIGWYIYK